MQPMPASSPVHDAGNMRGMTVEFNCIGCGVCAKVCLMDNIHVENGRAMIGDACISCLACFHWCPRKAIWMSKAEEDVQRRLQYRHSDVTLADIIVQKHK